MLVLLLCSVEVFLASLLPFLTLRACLHVLITQKSTYLQKLNYDFICSAHSIIIIVLLSAECTCVAVHSNSENQHEMNALRIEMRQCTDQVQKLTEEFTEIRKELEAARKEVDTTRSALSEIILKLLADN